VKLGEQLDTSTFFYIILDGVVDIKVTVAGGTTEEFTLASGESFDVKHLNLSFVNEDITAIVSSANANLFRCSGESVRSLSSKPETKDMCQGLLIAFLSDMVKRQYNIKMGCPKDEENQLQEQSICNRSSVFAPLKNFEQPPPYKAGSGSFSSLHNHLLHTLKVTFLLPWPLMKWVPGLRQIESLPIPVSEATYGARTKDDAHTAASDDQ